MERVSFHDAIKINKIKSVLLAILVLLTLVALFYVIALAFAPGFVAFVIPFAIIISLVHIYFSYMYGDKLVLKTVKAKPADEVKHRYLINTVEGLSLAAGIPKPKVYVMESKDINAFATGRNPENASVTVTTGLLQHLNREEIEGVVGHEISHIKNYDIRFSTLIAVLVGLAAIVSYFLLRGTLFGMGRRSRRDNGLILIIAIVFAIVAPLVTRMVQAAISREREYLADANGAELTRYPDGLAGALQKIKKFNSGKMKVSEAVSHLFFADPTITALDSLFATHPPLEKRVERLKRM